MTKSQVTQASLAAGTPAEQAQPAILSHLTISHFALIHHLNMDWHEGFSVITGETGAGKSIMLGALGMLLGARTDAKSIESGQKKCYVEATFQTASLPLQAFFDKHDIDYDGSECVLRRELTDTGKSRAFINDTPVQAARLKELGQMLIDIHSQHQNLLIRQEHFLIHALDTLAGQPEVPARYAEAYAALRCTEQALHDLREQAAKGQAEEEYMRFQHNQLCEANLQEGELETLEAEQQMLSHAEDIQSGLSQAQSLLSDETGTGANVTQSLRQAARLLHNVASHISAAASLAERLESAGIELQDIMEEMERTAQRVEYDPARLDSVQSRLDTLYSLMQKHHVQDVQSLVELRESLGERLNQLTNLDDDLAALEKQHAAQAKVLAQRAAELTALRQAAGKQLAADLVALLQALGMPHARVALQLTPRQQPDASGADNVTLLFSANKNVPEQDVSLIASGGEIARLMLALKAILARHKSLPTIIFDEIDTGVSGSQAERMAQVMQQMSAHCQVICITHLPQIAACGQHQYRVYKTEDEQGTRSHISELTPAERVEAIAHMLSGTAVTQAAIDNAQALLAHASALPV